MGMIRIPISRCTDAPADAAGKENRAVASAYVAAGLVAQDGEGRTHTNFTCHGTVTLFAALDYFLDN